MADPRSLNARSFAIVDGKITGVDLAYRPHVTAKYELIKAELVDERSAQGQTVASVFVTDANNTPATVSVFLAWPWVGWAPGGTFENRLRPGNVKFPYEHIIVNKYSPPERGPLAIYVGDNNGNVMSDVIAGLGLPMGHHVSYQLVFRERGVVTPPPPVVEMGDVYEILDRIEAKVDQMRRHFAQDI